MCALTKLCVTMQVQGQALMPGAAMFEMAASAAATVALSVGAAALPALLGVSIPAPLPLSAQAASSSTLLSVVLDTASARLTVQSQAATGSPPRLHLAASAGIAAVITPTVEAQQAATAASRLAAALQFIAATQHASGTAVADLQQECRSQAAQYNVHPAVLDCCTQVRICRNNHMQAERHDRIMHSNYNRYHQCLAN